MWVKKRRGSSNIYVRNGFPHAIVDRRGFGIASAVGHNITYRDITFKTIDEAIEYANTHKE